MGRRVARVATQTSFVLGVAMIAMLWTGIVLKFKDQAAGNYRDAVLNTQNLALLFEENILRTVGEVDKALHFMRRQIGQHPDSADPHRIVSNSDIFNELIVQFAIIDATGTLVYMGGMDDKPSTQNADVKTATNYVQVALDEVRSAKPVSSPVTRPYGCSVKY